MSKVVAAVGIIALGVATGGFGFAAAGGISTFLSSTFGRLLTTVAFSALRAALSRKSGSAGSAAQPGIRTSQTQTGGTNPASFILGRYATEGSLACPTMSHGTVGGVPNAYLTYVIELGDIPGQTLAGLIVDGEQVQLGAANSEYGMRFLGRFAGYGWVKFYDGTQTAADPMLIARYGNYPVRPWTADMVGRGVNYAIVTTRYNRNIFTSFPKVRFVLGGIPLYDPRKDSSVGGVGAHRFADPGTWEQSENPAVQIYNIKRGIDFGGGYIWGGGASAEDLPLSNWWAQMNNADQQIALTGGGTEAQYRSSFEVLAEDEPAKIIEEILNACSGELAENGGIWKLRLGGPGLPVYFLTDADVIISESEEYSPFRAEQEPYNGVAVVYPDPTALWEPRDAPTRYNAEYALANPAQRRVADLTLSAAPYPNQIQRVMRAYVEEERRIVRHVLTLPQDALVLEALDVVSWSSDHHGYAAKAFEIDAHIDPLLTGTPRVTLKERDPDDVAWVPGYELPYVISPTEIAPLDAQQVDGFAVTAVAIEDENGDPARPAIKLVWNGDQEDVRAIEFEIEAEDGTSILKTASLSVSSGEHVVAEGILPNKAYRARARFVVYRPTAWTDFAPVTTLDLRLRPEDLDQTTFQVNGLALFGGTLQSDNFVPDVSGWQINRNGSMELRDLVAREWIQIGAVSQGGSIIGTTAPFFRSNGSGVQTFYLGAFASNELWQIAVTGDYRHAGFTHYDIGLGQWYRQSRRVTLYFQITKLAFGVWTPWENFAVSPESNSLSSFRTFGALVPVIGVYDNAAIRAVPVFREVNEGIIYPPPRPGNFNKPYIKNLSYIGKAVVR